MIPVCARRLVLRGLPTRPAAPNGTVELLVDAAMRQGCPERQPLPHHGPGTASRAGPARCGRRLGFGAV